MANISRNIPDNNLKKTLFAILKLFVQSNNYAIHHIGNLVKTSRIIKKLKKNDYYYYFLIVGKKIFEF